MSPPTRERAVVHLRIGRLVIDGDALGGSALPRDLDAQLHAALLPLLSGRQPAEIAPAAITPVRPSWVQAVAGEIATQVQPSLSGRSP